MTVIINDWENAQKYNKIAQIHVDKKHIWSYKQNYPDLIVDDIIKIIKDNNGSVESDIKDKLYSILLKRGVNKWLATRKLFIRLKKIYSCRIRDFEQRMMNAKREGDWRKYWYYKGKMSAYVDVRMETSVLCKGPRWIIFNGREIGLVDTIGMKKSNERNWLKLYDVLRNIKFKK